ncbi:phage tail assembly chaperone [Paraburkholderia edwinii]|nr:phage tail assembly chaperone [Paraburkholderia edwinii]
MDTPIMTNDELLAMLQMEYPDAVPGKDYLIVVTYEDGVNQSAHARLWQWTHPTIPRPTDEFLNQKWADNHPKVREWKDGDYKRAERNRRLIAADALVERAIDKQDADAERAARTYRQALRDVPQQDGFPNSFEWPSAPK